MLVKLWADSDVQVSGGLTFRIFEWQAVALARLFAGRAKLPSKLDMKRWESVRLSTRSSLSFCNIAPDYEDYFETLRRIADSPTPDTTARELPKFETWWQDEFLTVIETRKRWWEAEARKALEEHPAGILIKNESLAQEETTAT